MEILLGILMGLALGCLIVGVIGMLYEMVIRNIQITKEYLEWKRENKGRE